jgi:hypothetical protein
MPRERGQAMLRSHVRLASSLVRLAPALAMALLLAGQAAPSSAQNLLTNPRFDTSLDGWTVVSPAAWDGTLDAGEDFGRSGSAKGVFDASMATGVDGVVGQCVPLTVGTTYHLGGKIFLQASNTAPGGAAYLMIPFPTADCSGPPPPGPIITTPEVFAVNTWSDSSTTFANTFAQSGQMWAALAPQGGGHLQANFDDVVVAPGAVACTPDQVTLCLLAGRFRVAAIFDTGNGDPANAQAAPLGNSGYFWFFDAGNVEVLVKLLDGCAIGGHFWFFAAGLTNVNVVITVTDTQTGVVQTYTNPANTAFQPIQDTSAFACP